MSTRLRWLVLPTIIAAILMAVAVVTMSLSAKEARSQDNASNPAAERPVSSGDGPARQSASEIRAYWTKERMQNAKPADITIPGSPADGAAGPASPQGPAVKIPPSTPSGSSQPGATSEQVQPMATTADGYTYPFPFTRYEVFAKYTAPQYKTNGKVFFTMNGSNFVCSGTVVNSENKSIVWTAGHCVHGGAGGTLHTNWQFVPAYRDGNAPLGVWTARELWTLQGWSVNGSFRYDLGAAVMNLDSSGRRIANFIGSKGISFNVSSVQAWHDFGYPQASPFNGNRQNVCAASYAESDSPPDGVSGPATIGIGCDMTGGSSGGGWVLNFSRTGGFVNSVNSYKYNAEPLSMYGPYHGDGALNLYNAVRNR